MRILLFAVLFCCAANVPAQRLVPFLKGKEWKVYDRSLQKLTGATYDNVVPARCGLLFVNTKGKWGAINSDGKAVLPQEYASVQQLNEQVLLARDAKGILLTDTSGVAISKQRYKEASRYKSDKGLIVVKDKKNNYGIIDSKGKSVLACRYDFAPEHLNGGYLKVAVRQPNGEALQGLLDSNFRELLAMNYHSVEVMHDGSIRCGIDGNRYVLYSPAMQEIYSGEYEPTGVLGGFIYIRDKNRYGFYIRKTGESVFCNDGWTYRVREQKGDAICYSVDEKKIRFYQANGDHSELDGYRLVYLDPALNCFVIMTGKENDGTGKYGIADFTGKILVPCNYGQMNIWNDRFFSVTAPPVRDEKGRYTSRYELYDIATGQKALPGFYHGIELFPLGGVALRDSSSWKLYDVNLKRWDDFEYTSVYRGQKLNAYSRVLPLYEVQRRTPQQHQLVGYIDGTGRPVIPAIYNEVRLVASNYNDGRPAPARINAVWYEDGDAWRRARHGVMLNTKGEQMPLANGVVALGYEMNGMITAYRDVRYEDESRSFCGLIDSMGNIVLPLEYDEVRQIGPGQGFRCTRNGVVTLTDEKGKILMVANGCSYVSQINEHFFVGYKQGGKSLIDAAGKTLTHLVYDEIYHEAYLNETLFRVKKNNTEYYIDNSGTEFYEP